MPSPAGTGWGRFDPVSKPRWRQAFDTVDGIVGPRLEKVTRAEGFAEAVGLASRLRREATNRGERVTRRALHFWNLPAGSDVTRILERMAALERQVRALSKQLSDQSTPPADQGKVMRDAAAPRRRRSRLSDQA